MTDRLGEALARWDEGHPLEPYELAVIMAAARSWHTLEPALEQLRRALTDEGRRPDYHRVVMARHRREWPTLWRAVDALTVTPTPEETG